MGERLEDRARRIANDIEGRDLEAAETLRAMAARTPGPATAAMVKHVEALKYEPAGGAMFIAVARDIQDDADAFLAEHKPT